MKTNLYVFDLDGTLADLTHRLHYIRKPVCRYCKGLPIKFENGSTAECLHCSGNFKDLNWKKDWNGFFDAVDKDKPIKWVMDLLDNVRGRGEVLILSGRSQATENKTREWLRKHDILYDYLVMRPTNNHKPDYIIKRYMLEDFLRDKAFQVQFIVDDRQSVVDMWRKIGYNVLQCQAWKDTDRQK